MHKLLFLWCLLASINVASAEELYAWLPALVSHPNVSVIKADIESQYWQIEELEAKRGFDIGVATTGDVPIFSNLESDFTRASDADPYLDVVVSGSYTLYDFGLAQQNINAENSIYELKRLEYIGAVEKELGRLLTSVVSNQQVLEQLTILKTVEPQLKTLQQQLVTRYEAGIGTITEVRQIQVQLLDLSSQISLLENRLQALQLGIEEQYDLSSEDLDAIWHDVKYVLLGQAEVVEAQRSESISVLKVRSLLHRQASVQAQAMPTLVGELHATLYDVTRSFQNHKLGGQVKLNMPIYDSGYRDVRLGKLQHAINAEMDIKRQLQRQRQFQLNDNLRTQADINASSAMAQEKLHNQEQQLNSLRQALGKTSSDVNGIASSLMQLATTRNKTASLQAEQSLNTLERLQITEQLLTKLGIETADIL